MYCTYFYISNFVGFGDRILLALTLLGLFPYASSLTFFFFFNTNGLFFCLGTCVQLCAQLSGCGRPLCQISF